MRRETPAEGATMTNDQEYDPFARQQPQRPQPGMVEPSSSQGWEGGEAQPGFIPPGAAPPMPSAQAGMGGVPPMPPSPYGYGAVAPRVSGQKNYLGILSLIFPFVLLSGVGIIMGHLGLSAVKKGTANNHGVALAGTIVSWVFTVLVVPGVLAAIALPLYASQQDKAHDAAARADLASLRAAVASHFVEQSVPPVVAIDGTHYVVGDQTEPKWASIDDVDFVMTGAASYCIAVTYNGDHVRSISETGVFSWGGCLDSDPPEGLPAGTGVDAAADAGTEAAPDRGTDAAFESDVVAFSALTVGDCIADPYDNIVEDESGESWISGVTIVDCASAHYGEIYSVNTMQAGTYVEDDIYAQGDDLCYFAFEDFMGVAYSDSEYYYDAYYPSPMGWELGDHETTCVVTSFASDTVGTLRGSGR